MRIFKTSTEGLFTLTLTDKKYGAGIDFDSINFISNHAYLYRSGHQVNDVECFSDVAALELYNAAVAFSIPCTLKYCNFITPATDGIPADEQLEDAA